MRRQITLRLQRGRKTCPQVTLCFRISLGMHISSVFLGNSSQNWRLLLWCLFLSYFNDLRGFGHLNFPLAVSPNTYKSMIICTSFSISASAKYNYTKVNGDFWAMADLNQWLSTLTATLENVFAIFSLGLCCAWRETSPSSQKTYRREPESGGKFNVGHCK